MPANRTSYDEGRTLLQIARAAIAEALDLSVSVDEDISEDTDWLREKGACFITLMQQDRLRGCIGTTDAHSSLLDDVKFNAKAAAFKDTRFPPLSSEELNNTQIEVSLLSPMQALNFVSEQDALNQLQPGVDGVMFAYGHQHSTFLPQVWEQLPDARIFMANLKHKAGLPANFWADDIELSRYTVSKWKESDFDMLSDVRSEALSEV